MWQVRADAQADLKMRARLDMRKFTHDTIAQQHGLKTVTGKSPQLHAVGPLIPRRAPPARTPYGIARSDFMKHLRQFAIASDGPLQPLLHMFAQMLGLLEGAAWSQLQVDFLLLVLCQVVL